MDAAKGATRPPPPNPAVPHREDCWSEGATAALIGAWGERFVELDRGHLRQKHWQEVADAVNSRRTAARRPPRTDVQCKNRVDTIKKKYKSERVRIAETGGSSSWPFYDRLDALIGDQSAAGGPSRKLGGGSGNNTNNNNNNNSTPTPLEPPVAVPLPRRKGSPLPPPAAVASRPAESQSLLRKGIYSVAAAAAAAAAAREEDEVESGSSGGSSAGKGGGWREEEGGGGGEGEAGGVRELARAIRRFGEVYERVEAAKQKQMLELERQRMEFVKGLEFQRMKMFVDSQVQLERVKRAKGNAGSSAAAGE